MVYSNGTGAYFDPDTKVDIKQFDQEPFRPNRTDMEVEPSISQTQAYVSKGTVGLCTAKLVAGSSMNYSTPQGSVSIRGRKVVIDVGANTTTISMVEGDSTVQGGPADTGGHVLHDGQQAVITNGANGAPANVTIQDIPANQRSSIDDKVTAACIARKTVYFEAVAAKNSSTVAGIQGATGEAAAGAGEEGAGSVFLGGSVNGNSGTTGGNSGGNQQIVAVQVVPTTQSTPPVSAAFIPGR